MRGFIAKFADKTRHLSNGLKTKETKWQWIKEMNEEFSKIKIEV